MIRYDTQTPAIVSINIVNSQGYQAQSIVAISNNQVFYSYRETGSGSDLHHLAKADFSEDSGTYSLTETHHKTIAGDSTLGSISRLSHDDESLWHAVNLGTFVTYFQFNSTDLTLLGSKQDGDNAITSSGLSMEVYEEVV